VPDRRAGVGQWRRGAWCALVPLQGWGERPVFGKIRYMNYAGCKRKFDIPKYVAYVAREVADAKKAAAGSK
jgi:hypothetical protein